MKGLMDSVPELEGEALERALLSCRYVRGDVRKSDHRLLSLRERALGLGRGDRLVRASALLLDADRTPIGRVTMDGVFFRSTGGVGDRRREMFATERGPVRSLGLIYNKSESGFRGYVAAALIADAIGIQPGWYRDVQALVRIVRARHAGHEDSRDPMGENARLKERHGAQRPLTKARTARDDQERL